MVGRLEPRAVRLLVGTLVLMATAARAQAPVVLPPVDVPSHDSPSTDSPAPKSEPNASSVQVREPGSAVTTVELTERRAEAKDASDHLAQVPGAVIQDVGGAGQRKTLSLRGASSNAALVLLDGVPLTAPGESMDLSRIPAAALDRIEVLRGAGSRYGPGGMAGVVNLVPRSADGSHVFAEASQGSFLTTQGVVGGSTKLLGTDALLLVHGLHSNGDFSYRFDETPGLPGSTDQLLTRANNQALLGGGLLRLKREFGSTRVDLLAEGTLEQRGLAGTVQNPSPAANQRTARGLVSLRSTTDFESGGTLSVLANGRLDGSELTGTAFGSGLYRQQQSSAGVEAVYSRLLGRHGLTALATVGGEWLRAPTSNPAWARGGAMVGDEVLFLDGRLAVNGVVRVDALGPFVVLSPKAGVTAQLPAGFEVKATAGQASRPPSFAELYVVQGTLMPNPDLRPERGLTADATVGWSNRALAVGVTGFGALYEDLIAWEYYPPALAKPYNFAAASVMGLEAEARVHPVAWLDASASYTYQSTRNLRDDPRYYLKSLPFRPAHRVTARVVAGVPLANVRAEVLAQSAQFTNRTETVALPARAFVNLAVSSTPLKHPALTVSFEVKNVLDTQAQDVDGYPLPPRAAFVTLGLAWDGAPQ